MYWKIPADQKGKSNGPETFCRAEQGGKQPEPACQGLELRYPCPVQYIQTIGGGKNVVATAQIKYLEQ